MPMSEAELFRKWRRLATKVVARRERARRKAHGQLPQGPALGPNRAQRRAAEARARQAAVAGKRWRAERRPVPRDLVVPWWEKASKWKLGACLMRPLLQAEVRWPSEQEIAMRRVAARRLGSQPMLNAPVDPSGDWDQRMADLEAQVDPADPRLDQFEREQRQVAAAVAELKRRQAAGDRT